MAGFDQTLPLPGLEDPPANITPMIRSLRRTIAALDSSEMLEEVHALELQAAHLLARSAEMKLATGRASTIANDVELLLRISAGIREGADTEGVDEELRRAMEEFNARIDELEAEDA